MRKARSVPRDCLAFRVIDAPARPDRRELRMAVVLMFACWFGGLLLVRITAWTA
ncbi:hypothetical protein Nocox_32090 [Nonomuraea coxensis DSM 45129]|uniref:Uncharacterized protein n=1 Tax=Nonomuraea coxensis DSM 45129 TaxID=1122611 RepID=A0ABX8U980_9ACTN|nr:hypothetical protein Nocox_32090 [Nonomuraea coxensis DSM 45129]